MSMFESQPRNPLEPNPELSPRATDDQPARDDAAAGIPPAPGRLEEVGLSPTFLLELTLKVIRYAESPSAEHVARVLALPPKLVEALLESLKSDRLCEIVGGGSTYDLTTNYRFRLTERGETRAEQALERCRYAGAAPVTISQYQRIVGRQSEDHWRPSAESIELAFNRLVVDRTAATLLSKALRSGRCAMVFGPSGNGKTHLLAEFIRHLEGDVVVPHALYAYGQIIRIFDHTVHTRRDAEHLGAPADPSDSKQRGVAKEDTYDKRWVRIQRPGLVVGGELTSESLELGYDPVTKFYQAPKHLKAQGGVLLVDDFGRQKISPIDLLNRWIMALERGTDNLLLRTGESIEVPFDIRLLFSTNLDPADLADAAFLRRIPYKVQMPATGLDQFKQVLQQACEDYTVNYSAADLDAVAAFIGESCDNPLSGALARDLVAIIVDNCHLESLQPALSVQATALAYLQFTGTEPRGFKAEDVPAPAAVAVVAANGHGGDDPANPPSEAAAWPSPSGAADDWNN